MVEQLIGFQTYRGEIMEGLRLNDEVIANIAKMIQVAMLTGTDVVDNLRMIRLIQVNDSTLGIHEDFREQLKKNISDMLNAVENYQEDHKEDPD